MLASASVDGTVKFWDPTWAEDLTGFAGSEDPIWFSRDGKQLITHNLDGRLHLWETARQKPIRIIGPPVSDTTAKIAVSEDGQRLALGTTNRLVEIWNLQTSQRDQVFQVDEVPTQHLLFCQKAGVLAAASEELTDSGWQGAVRIWNLANQRLEVIDNAFGPLAFTSDGTRLVWCRSDGGVVIWDLEKRVAITTLLGHKEWVGCLALSPDDKLLATGCPDTTVHIWEMTSGRKQYSLQGNRMGVAGAAFSPDGKTLVTANWDNVIKFWNVGLGAELFSVEQSIPGFAVLFSPNGEYLAVMGDGGGHRERQVELWRAPSFQEIKAAERARGR